MPKSCHKETCVGIWSFRRICEKRTDFVTNSLCPTDAISNLSSIHRLWSYFRMGFPGSKPYSDNIQQIQTSISRSAQFVLGFLLHRRARFYFVSTDDISSSPKLPNTTRSDSSAGKNEWVTSVHWCESRRGGGIITMDRFYICHILQAKRRNKFGWMSLTFISDN